MSPRAIVQGVELPDWADIVIARVWCAGRQADLHFRLVCGRIDESRLPKRDIKTLLAHLELPEMAAELSRMLYEIQDQIDTERLYAPETRRRLGHGLASMR